MTDDKGASFGIGIILGVFIGAAIALILAPQPGDKTREMLKTKADEWSAKAKDAYREGLKEGKEVAGKAREELRARFEKEKE